MKVFIIGIGWVRFWFEHHRGRDRNAGTGAGRAYTAVHCERAERNGVELGVAKVTLFSRDTFVKSTGRRKALTKLLTNSELPLSLTKDQRRDVWLAYFMAHNDLSRTSR